MKNVALVIGNAAYLEKPLDNPGNDARDMATALRKFNFEVHQCVDGTYLEMERALKDFRAELYDADVGLFFFAGHGIQIEGANYLLAVDTKMDSELDAKHSAMKLDLVIDCLEKANTTTSVVILDACRNNPWERRWERSVAGNGLASVYAPRGTLIAFATSPGQVARDGKGKRNGIYTSALLEHIGTPDCTIEAMFKRVRNTLSVATNGKQISWEHTSLAGEFFFNLSVGARIDAYKPTSLRDGLLELDDTLASHEIIRNLKVLTWDVQNSALVGFGTAVATNFSKDNLFVIGRNIYQAASGNANGAMGFVNDFMAKTKGLKPEKRKALLDGMLFEIFFDSDGKIRDDFKARYFNKVFALQKHVAVSSSFDFIAECLLPYSNRFYALPGKTSPVAVDIVLNLSKARAEPDAVQICIASEDVLRPDDDSEGPDYEVPTRFRTQGRDDFEERISTQLLIPLRLLSFTYTGVGRKPASIRFPAGWTVRQRAN
ncbi:caspase domain-containing protein [Pseudomonas sp. NPDC099000]|uniref:caspase family protein n=1 Tax=Pseudomonas sp. NPDC099000 TaxID=3364488 RepID=UPI00383AA61A